MRSVYRRLRLAIPVLLVAALGYRANVGWTSAKNNTQQGMPQHLTAKCTQVVDGDSLYLQGFKSQVRLWGVDAPERNERGYAEAKSALTALAYGRTLHCERQEIDKYGRMVARCFVATDVGVQAVAPDVDVSDKDKQTHDAAPVTGPEINRQLIERGAASEYCWFSKGFYGHCK